MEVPDKIRIFRGGKFYTRTVFPPGGKNYTDSRSRGKDYAGAVFPPKGERWARARLSGGKNYAGGKSMLQHRYGTNKDTYFLDQKFYGELTWIPTIAKPHQAV